MMNTVIAETKRNKKMMKKKNKKNATRKIRYMASVGGIKRKVHGFSNAATNAINARKLTQADPITKPQINAEKYPDIPSDILAPHPEPFTKEQIEKNAKMTEGVRIPPPISPRSYLLNKKMNQVHHLHLML